MTRRALHLTLAGLLFLLLIVAVAVTLEQVTDSVTLKGQLWAAYSDNPVTKEHRFDYYLHTPSQDYILDSADVKHIPVGSLVELKGEFPFGMNAAEAILHVPQVTLVAPAPAADLKNSGSQRWLSILCKYSDHPEEPYSADFIQNLMSAQAPGMSDYWGRVSNNKLIVDARTVVGPYTLDQPHYAYWAHWDDDPTKRIYDVGRVGNDCAKKAAADHVDLDRFDGIIFFMNFEFDGTAKGGTMVLENGQHDRVIRAAWIPYWKDSMLATTAHEVGHGESFAHSTDARSLKDHSLGNPWDVMGDIWIFCHFKEDQKFGCVAQYPMAYWRGSNGWIKIAKATHKTGVKVFHIAPSEEITDLPQALFIPVNDTEGYMLEVRRPTGPYDGKLPPDNNGGALLTWISPNALYPVTLIDMDGDGNDNPDDGSAVLVPVHLLGTSAGVTMCILGNDADGGMTIAIGKQNADCSKG